MYVSIIIYYIIYLVSHVSKLVVRFEWLNSHVRFEVLTAVKMLFSWIVTPLRLVARCQLFGGTYCLHL
jgi:hypothetical protein